MTRCSSVWYVLSSSSASRLIPVITASTESLAGDRQPGGQVARRQLDDQIHHRVQPFVVECFRHSPPPVVTRCWLARSVAASIA